MDCNYIYIVINKIHNAVWLHITFIHIFIRNNGKLFKKDLSRPPYSFFDSNRTDT